MLIKILFYLLKIILKLKYILTLILYTHYVFSCMLVNNIEGICVNKEDVLADLKFCGGYILDSICVPLYFNLWPEWTNSTIDLELEQAVINNIQNEFMQEITNQASMTLINSVGCLESYIAFVCKNNFRGCNKLTDTTNNMCQSVCDTFSTKCSYFNILCTSLPTQDYSNDTNCYK